MEIWTNFFLPALIVSAIVGLYAWFLRYQRKQRTAAKVNKPRNVIKSAPVVPYYDSITLSFYEALRKALPEKYIIYVNVPIEKLFEQSKRESLHMLGQYADYVVFTPSLMPVLVVDLYDMSIINLDRVNRIKAVSKEILRNSGIPVLDYQYNENCNIDELRRKIANLLNPLGVQ
ncbi:MAG: DUF2726 domain-containing protein [Clostridia bacterium]|nr:DUF2726 domain-containing protein [Clostridia bacterium]